MSDTYLCALRKINDAECEEDSGSRQLLLDEAIAELMHANLESAETQYALGYAWYLQPVETDLRDQNILKHLKMAIYLDPAHRYARLYMAHNYFDKKEFADALQILLKFESNEFSEIGQSWRDVKIAELILCCKLRLVDVEGLSSCIDQLCTSLTYLEPDMNPSPSELASTLIWLLTRKLA